MLQHAAIDSPAWLNIALVRVRTHRIRPSALQNMARLRSEISGSIPSREVEVPALLAAPVVEQEELRRPHRLRGGVRTRIPDHLGSRVLEFLDRASALHGQVVFV